VKTPNLKPTVALSIILFGGAQLRADTIFTDYISLTTLGGGTISGDFDIDTTNLTESTLVDISFTGDSIVSRTFTDLTFSPLSITPTYVDALSVTNVELQLSFANPFTTPSTDLVLSGDFLAAARTDEITGGYATPVPEPSTGFTALMGALAVLGLARIRKFRLEKQSHPAILQAH
jgi:hypothetical protein